MYKKLECSAYLVIQGGNKHVRNVCRLRDLVLLGEAEDRAQGPIANCVHTPLSCIADTVTSTSNRRPTSEVNARGCGSKGLSRLIVRPYQEAKESFNVQTPRC